MTQAHKSTAASDAKHRMGGPPDAIIINKPNPKVHVHREYC